jgi:hypothetical protein
MNVSVEPLGGAVRIEFDSFDGYVFATRPNAAWPGSELRHGPDNKYVELDESGDLVDSGNIPDDCTANELNAFVEFALEHARNKLTEALTTAQFKNTWPADR